MKFKIIIYKITTIALLCLCVNYNACTTKTKQQKQTKQNDTIVAYKLKVQGPDFYIIKYNDELYNVFFNWGKDNQIDSVCKDLGLEIDTTLLVEISNNTNLFDTLYFANYSIERIIFDRSSVCLTNDECFLHTCSRVGQINIHFKLSDSEKAILNSLISYCGLDEKIINKKEVFQDPGINVSVRIRVVKEDRYYDLLFSDTSTKYKEIALLNCFIIGLTNKYICLSEESEIPTFLLPVH